MLLFHHNIQVNITTIAKSIISKCFIKINNPPRVLIRLIIIITHFQINYSVEENLRDMNIFLK